MSQLQAEHIALGYGGSPVVDDFDLRIEDGTITTIIGPNGCGKSTVLRALSRLMKPAGGAVLLDGQSIHQLPTRIVAQRLGLLAQQATLPESVTVEDLVRRGRYPHQAFLQPPSRKDEDAVLHAMELAGVTGLRHRQVDQLSGGQRQRAWIAMVLAQETPLLLLDEPTTFLDVAHQLEVMELIRKLNRDEGRTIVMVLHDINEAAINSDRLLAMRDGRIIGEGTPTEVLTPRLLTQLYGVDCDVYPHPVACQQCDGYCVPRSRAWCESPVHRMGHADTGSALRGPSVSRRALCDGSCLPGANAEGFAIDDIRTGYGRSVISDQLSLAIPGGKVTAIVGPNACGKSTLMRSCARLQKLGAGTIRLDGQDVTRGSHRVLARRLALLSQGATPPDGVVVEDLVAAGRYPHQGWLRRWTAEDEEMVEWALERCRLTEFRHREIETLSGGQRQRAWFAMSLVQDTPALLLDEPTTFLDIAAQIELLDIIWSLNREQGRTVVMVLHDLNLAARYADHLIAMKDGNVVATGAPDKVMTAELVRLVFDIEAKVMTDPLTQTPLIVPSQSIGKNISVTVEAAALVS